MGRNFGSAVLLVLLCVFARHAVAQSYLLAGAGSSTNHVDFTQVHDRDREFDVQEFSDRGNSAIVSLGMGAGLQQSLRSEFVLSYRPEYESRVNPAPATPAGSSTIGSRSRLQTLSALASLYYDFPIHSRFKPYVGGGIGVAHNQLRVDSITPPGVNGFALQTLSGNHFAWQLGGGVAYEIGSTVALDLGYRYFDGGSVGLGQTLHAQEVQLGIRLRID